MSDPTDDPRPYLKRESEMREDYGDPEEPLWDAVKRDIDARDEQGVKSYGDHLRGTTRIVGVNAAYEEILDAVVYMKHAQRAYNRMAVTLSEQTEELKRLKSLESYKAQEARIAELEATNRALAERTRSLEMTLPTARVEALEQQLHIARKANHLEDLQAAEKRIIELERKLEELEHG